MEQHYYAAMHINEDICRKSSSGGAFTAITDAWFAAYPSKSVVYGCAMDEQLRAKHIRATNQQQRDQMRGSKYIGSDMSGVMRLVEQDLKNDLYVLFSGTPCQIAGLKSFLNVKGVECGSRLLTLEVICHGVGSVRFFEDYIQSFEKRYKSKVVRCNFRGKCRPGKRQQMVLGFANGKTYESPSIRYDGFYSAYLRNFILRPSCYVCPYARQEREADISIADDWRAVSEQTSRSLVIANSEAGWKWADTSLMYMRYEEIAAEQVFQPNMHHPCEKPADYDSFWSEYHRSGYSGTQKILGNDDIKSNLKKVAIHFVYHFRILDTLKLLTKRK